MNLGTPIKIVFATAFFACVSSAPFEANAAPSCDVLFSSTAQHNLADFTPRFEGKHPVFVRVYLEHNGVDVAELEARRLPDKVIQIKEMNVDVNYRRLGLGTKLFSELVSKVGTDHSYKTLLGIDNQAAFKKAYEQSELESPTLSEAERNLLALYATPAWKYRVKAGLTKIQRLSVEWNNYGGVSQPDIVLVVTGNR